jgi:hypothetical protein
MKYYRYFLASMFSFFLANTILDEIFGILYTPWEFIAAILILIINFLIIFYAGEFFYYLLKKITFNNIKNEHSESHTDEKN